MGKNILAALGLCLVAGSALAQSITVMPLGSGHYSVSGGGRTVMVTVLGDPTPAPAAEALMPREAFDAALAMFRDGMRGMYATR